MIRLIMNKDWGNFNSLLTVLAVLYTCVFLSVLIDLFFGVRRAKRLKIVRTSFGYRRTITKLTSYFGLMIMLSIADIVASVVFDMPYFTVKNMGKIKKKLMQRLMISMHRDSGKYLRAVSLQCCLQSLSLDVFTPVLPRLQKQPLSLYSTH